METHKMEVEFGTSGCYEKDLRRAARKVYSEDDAGYNIYLGVQRNTWTFLCRNTHCGEIQAEIEIRAKPSSRSGVRQVEYQTARAHAKLLANKLGFRGICVK